MFRFAGRTGPPCAAGGTGAGAAGVAFFRAVGASRIVDASLFLEVSEVSIYT